MRLHTPRAATTAGVLAGVLSGALAIGALGIPAHANIPSPPAKAGTVITWGDQSDIMAQPAMEVPADLGLARSVAATQGATGVVTVDGAVRVWGGATSEVSGRPTGVTNATAIALTSGNGAILHADGKITAWGNTAALRDVPAELRAKAIAIQPTTGYAVRPDGTLTTWGEAPLVPLPETGLTNLVDVSVAFSHGLALRADGTVVTWGVDFLPGLLDVPDFGGKKVVKVATALGYSGVILDDGSIEIWGAEGMAPTGQPDFDGVTPAGKVVDLSLGADAAAVTADGAVHAWGPTTAVTNVPASLTGQPVSAVALGANHVATIVTAFRDLTKPIITGRAELGQTLTATPATFSLAPDAAATGQWYAEDAPIAGETATTLAVESSLLGKPISYRTTATRDDQTLVSSSAATTAVTRATSTTKLSVSPATGVAGATRTVTATVSSAGAVPTGTVSFTGMGTTVTRPLSSGKATWTMPTTLPVGNNPVTASYSGDSNTQASTSPAASVTVSKADAKVSGKGKATGKTKKIAKKVTIAITVTAPNGVSPAGKVTVTLKGKTKKKVTVKVNAKGKATATFKKVKRGKYSATLKYTGNAQVKTATGKAKFKA